MTAYQNPVNVFLSYAHKDKELLPPLEDHLSMLKREGLISTWCDRQIMPGTNWARVIDQHIEQATLILLLVSAAFLASDYCYQIEMTRALERHQAGQAIVIPIVARPVDWRTSPIAALQALPTNAKPITTWSNQDDAFFEVAVGIRKAIVKLMAQPPDPAYKPWPVTDGYFSAGVGNQGENKPFEEYRGPQERSTMGTNANPGRPASEGGGNVYGGQFQGGQFQAPIFTGEGQTITYNNTTAAVPDRQKEGILALERGTKALLNMEYASARKQLRMAIDDIDLDQHGKEAAQARYLNALAILGNERPQDKGIAALETLGELLSTAIRLDRCDTYIMARALILTPALSRQAYNPLITSYDRSLLDYMQRCQPDLYQRIREVFGI